MGKIRVQDLAQMMQISNQDLIFKLKSIGVRVEGDDAQLDTDIIQAILAGKKLPHPREVILRDAQEQVAPPAARRRPAVPQRPAVNPLRPGRPRTLIQRVEPRIQSMPVSERPAASPLAQGAQGVQNAAMPEATGEPAHETALPAPAAPAGGGSPAPHLPTAPTAPTTPISSAPSAPGAVYRPAPTSAQPARPAAPISTYTRPAQGAPAPSRPQP
ncbi:MAG TPA: translation initiation factor IF-2 N-terminal domain-containing protein, partial [Thermoanaerobaculia bacterium]